MIDKIESKNVTIYNEEYEHLKTKTRNTKHFFFEKKLETRICFVGNDRIDVKKKRKEQIDE